jgi:hypothetical protein
MIKGIVTAALLLAFASGPEGSAQQTGIGYKPATDADSKKTILSRTFAPSPRFMRPRTKSGARSFL